MPCLPKPLNASGQAKGMYLKHKGHEVHKVFKVPTLVPFVYFVVKGFEKW